MLQETAAETVHIFLPNLVAPAVEDIALGQMVDVFLVSLEAAVVMGKGILMLQETAAEAVQCILPKLVAPAVEDVALGQMVDVFLVSLEAAVVMGKGTVVGVINEQFAKFMGTPQVRATAFLWMPVRKILMPAVVGIVQAAAIVMVGTKQVNRERDCLSCFQMDRVVVEREGILLCGVLDSCKL